MTALRTGRHACGIVAARRVLSLALHPGTREAQFSDAVFEEAGEGRLRFYHDGAGPQVRATREPSHSRQFIFELDLPAPLKCY